MTKEIQTYLEWRCRMNWHPKYYKYIQEWIANVLPYQIEYFEKERKHLIDKGIYN
jgi:hypothetical protein